jgi:hypothetical protein
LRSRAAAASQRQEQPIKEIAQKEVRKNGVRLTMRSEEDCQEEDGSEKNGKEKIMSWEEERRAGQPAFLPSSFLFSSRCNHKRNVGLPSYPDGNIVLSFVV